jgi:hypothetical protein
MSWSGPRLSNIPLRVARTHTTLAGLRATSLKVMQHMNKTKLRHGEVLALPRVAGGRPQVFRTFTALDLPPFLHSPPARADSPAGAGPRSACRL